MPPLLYCCTGQTSWTPARPRSAFHLTAAAGSRGSRSYLEATLEEIGLRPESWLPADNDAQFDSASRHSSCSCKRGPARLFHQSFTVTKRSTGASEPITESIRGIIVARSLERHRKSGPSPRRREKGERTVFEGVSRNFSGKTIPPPAVPGGSRVLVPWCLGSRWINVPSLGQSLGLSGRIRFVDLLFFFFFSFAVVNRSDAM